MGDAETLKEDALEEKEAAAESPGGQEVAVEAGVAGHGGKVLQVFPEGPLPSGLHQQAGLLSLWRRGARLRWLQASP